MTIQFKRLYQHWRSWLITKRHAGYEREKFEDRNVLERIIFPEILATKNPQKILDIGREDYQAFYNHFFEGRELWTLEKKASRRFFGSENHITDDVANLGNHFPTDNFDLIIMNGVFGWGLNQPKDIESAFAAIANVLKPGGIFILGWNNLPGLVPVPLENIEALKSLKPFCFKPLGGDCFTCVNGNHTYNFFSK